jgi:uncharacterized protein YndB with AHSA1/START domain/dihydrofolate reductase
MTVVSVDKDFDALELVLVAEFEAPVERVWQLWADPRKLERWWGPPTYPATFGKYDLTPGGEASFFMTGPAGERSHGWWRINAVEPPTFLAFTDGWADEDGRPQPDKPTTDVRMQLTERAGGTRMEIRSVFSSREHMDSIVSAGAVEAFAAAVGQMDGLLLRRFKLHTQVTLDGFMGGPNGEMDWTTYPWTKDLEAYADALAESVDTIVLGRKLAEGFIPAWESRPEGESDESIDWMINTPKVVISNTLKESPWANAVVAGGDLGEVIGELKARPGGDLIAYGGSTFVSSLIGAELLDELHLFVNPTAIGSGLPVFPDGDSYGRFELVATRRFDCGMAVLHLEPKR